MNNYFIYLLISSFYLCLFYGVFHFFFRKETLFQWNRIYLIGSSIIALLLPFIAWYIASAYNQLGIVVLNEINITLQRELGHFMEHQVMQKQLGLTVLLWLKWIYLIGVVLSMGLFLFKLFQVFILIHKNQHKQENGYQLVCINDNADFPVASFFHYLFVPAHFDITSNEHQKIIEHEKVHIRQKHSIDILLMEVLSIFFWFNPVLHFYKKSIQLNHEYLADEACVSHSTTANNSRAVGQYAMQILQQSMGQSYDLKQDYFLNFFNKTQIQKRIIMLSKSRSTQYSRRKYQFLLPLLLICSLILGTLWSCKSDQLNEDAPVHVFQDVAEMPQFPGGESKLMEFIHTNLKYPEKARAEGVEGLVVLSFVVDEEGKLSDFEVVKYLGGGCTEASMEVLKKMPQWSPGFHDGKAVKVSYKLPFRFKLE